MNASQGAMHTDRGLPHGARLSGGQYRILREMARGENAITYLAIDQELNINVLLWEYFAHGHCQRRMGDGNIVPLGDEHFRIFMGGIKDFREQARLKARCNGLQGCAGVYGMFRENGTVYVVQEYNPGQMLAIWLQNQPIRPGVIEAMDILGRAWEAIQAMHGRGVWMARLSLDSIFRCDDGRIILLQGTDGLPDDKPGRNGVPGSQLRDSHGGTRISVIAPGRVEKGLHLAERTSQSMARNYSMDLAAALVTMVSGMQASQGFDGDEASDLCSWLMDSPDFPEGLKPFLIQALCSKPADGYAWSVNWWKEMQQACAGRLEDLEPFSEAANHVEQAVQDAVKVDANTGGTMGSGFHKVSSENMASSESIDKLMAAVSAVELEESKPSKYYEGQQVLGMRHGIGRQIYDNGDEYSGEWKLGRRHGQGTHRYANGDEYTGQWKADRRHGQGVLKLAGGERYTGEWKDDERHGMGKEMLPSGEKYHGQWKNGKRSGSGVESFGNGDRYEGEWLFGFRNGYGVEALACGDRYDGQWKADKRHGQGQEILANGEEYSGAFKEDRRHGMGYVMVNGRREYTGEWRNGRPLM